MKEVRKGPRTDAPAAAINGFLKSAGLTDIADAQIETDPKKGDFYVATIERAGRPTQEVLAEILPPILTIFPWPKSMRWGERSAQTRGVSLGAPAPFDSRHVWAGDRGTGDRQLFCCGNHGEQYHARPSLHGAGCDSRAPLR